MARIANLDIPPPRAGEDRATLGERVFNMAVQEIREQKPNFEVIRHDVVLPILLEVDQIYHLACPASPIHYK